MYKYSVIGKISRSYKKEGSGLYTRKVNAVVESLEKSASEAFDVFFRENDDCYFDGSLKMYDAQTRGQVWAVFVDSNLGQRVEVTLLHDDESSPQTAITLE